MKEKILKNKTIVIIAAAVVLAAIGFTAGMMVKTSLAKDSGNYIGAEKAKTIALESVGVSPSKATFTKVEIDHSDNPVAYDIEFYTASNEYEFEVDANSGEVLEKSSEAITGVHHSTDQAAASSAANTDAAAPTASQNGGNSSTGSDSTSASSEYIGVNKAKSIAFHHAGVSASGASVTKAKLDSDDGVKTYEIEFVAGNTEYEYEINAYTGKVMDCDTEKLNSHHTEHHNSNHNDHDYDD